MKLILIAEQNPKLRTIFAEVVQRSGWEPILAQLDGPLADQIRSLKPAVVVGDLCPSVDEARTLLKQLKQDRDTMGVPVIFVSVTGEPSVMASMLLSGASDYLICSDLSIDLIRDKIATQLEGKAPRKERGSTIVRLSDQWRSMAGVPTERDPDSIRKRVRRIEELEVLSPVARELVDLIQSEKTSVRDLVSVISLDPGLSAKLLQLANTAYYRGSKPFTSIKRAVVRIGFTGVRSLALAVSVLGEENEEVADEIARIYDHSVATAALCDALARTTGHPEPDRAFLCGLLHDVGKVIVTRCFEEEVRRIRTWTRQRDVPAYRIEQRVLAMDHCRIASLLLDTWKIPLRITAPILYHHAPQLARTVLAEEDQKIAVILYLADNIAKAIHQYSDQGNHLDYIGFDHTEFLGLTRGAVEEAIETARAHMEELRQILLGGRRPVSESLMKSPPTVVLVREEEPALDVLEWFLKTLGASITASDQPTGTQDVPKGTIVVTSLAKAANFAERVEELMAREGSERNRLRRHILVAAEDVPRDELNAARKDGIGAVSHPVSISEIVRLLERAGRWAKK